MDDKLREVFTFLEVNRKYNKELQTKCYRADVKPYDIVKDKVLSLLYRVANTQSGQKLDKLGPTYRFLYDDLRCLESFDNFIKHLNQDKYKKEHQQNKRRKTKGKFDTLYHVMEELSWMGPKNSRVVC